MVLSISKKTLKRAFDFFDKIIGRTQEKRYIFLGGPQNIFLLGSDGLITAQLILKEGLSLPYTYRLPLDLLRAFLKDLSEEELKIEIGPSLRFRGQREVLELKEIKQTKLLLSKTKREKSVSLNLSTFCRILDLASVISEEGEEIIIFFHANTLGVIGENKNFLVCAFMPFSGNQTHVFSLPYTSTRHLVKALKIVTEKRVSFYLDSKDLLISVPRLKILVRPLFKRKDDLNFLWSLINTDPLVQFKLELKTLKIYLSRLSRLERQLNPFGTIIFNRNFCMFKLSAKEGTYTLNLPIKINFQKEISFKCRFSVLNSVCQRLKGKELKISLLPSGCLIRYRNFLGLIR